AGPMAPTQRFTAPIPSSRSPSIVVNIEPRSWGSPLSRTTRRASATAAAYESPSPGDAGAMEKASSMGSSWSGAVVDLQVAVDPGQRVRLLLGARGAVLGVVGQGDGHGARVLTVVPVARRRPGAGVRSAG